MGFSRGPFFVHAGLTLRAKRAWGPYGTPNDCEAEAARVTSGVVSKRSRILLLLVAIAGYSLGIVARNEAWAERSHWPVTAQAVVAPQMAPLFIGLVGRELTADLFWIRTLIYAGSTIGETGGYQQLEQLINAVIRADRKFRPIYKFASYEITFRNEVATQEEFRLSAQYVEQGIKEFPDNYDLFWIGGLRYYLDLYSKDPVENRKFKERGAELIEEAMRKPDAPSHLATLAVSLRTKLGQRDRAISDLKQMIQMTENPLDREKLISRLRFLSSDDVANEVAQAAESFEVTHRRTLPYVPPGVFVILGERPPEQINLEELAAGPQLFGLDGDTP